MAVCPWTIVQLSGTLDWKAHEARLRGIAHTVRGSYILSKSRYEPRALSSTYIIMRSRILLMIVDTMILWVVVEDH